MIFRCGQKVVFIGDEIDCYGRDTLLTPGHVYTVRSLILDGFGVYCATIYEIEPEPPAPGWWIEWFRPVVDRKTDISIFKKLLIPTRENAYDR